MKKVISILAACMLVISFAGMASAQDAINAVNCGGDAGYIDRGCETEQGDCLPFDFDHPVSYGTDYLGNLVELPADYNSAQGFGFGYCDKKNNRAVFPICDCDFAPDMRYENIYEIGMEIMIDKDGDGVPESEGNNGVYWAQELSAINLWTYSSQSAACTDTDNSDAISAGSFAGPFDYLLANGSSTITIDNTTYSAYPSGSSSCEALDPNQKVVEIRNTLGAGGGYEISEPDDRLNASNWVIDIPAMRADISEVEAGWDVYVKVCLYETGEGGDGICADCESCCFLINVGTLCCPEEQAKAYQETLVFPYLGKTDGAWWNGMAVTNLSDNAGTADVTLYENGDVFTGTIDVPANGTTVVDVADLTLTTAGGDGVMGNERAYAKVVTKGFAASGFAMMAKEDNGVSMGYLAEKQ